MSNRTRRLLILDLDETLIHATEQLLGRAADFRLEHYHVYCRPYVNSFLQKMAEIYDLAVWSSATQDYVAGIVARIMPEGIEPKFTWGRGQCTRRYDPEWREDYYRKDLRKVKRLGYDLDDTLIVDDTPQKVEQHYGNAVYVREYCGHPEDDELVHLAIYLRSIADVDGLRHLEKRGWRQDARKNCEL